MKIKILITFLILLLCFACNDGNKPKKDKNDWEIMNLSGRVKSVKQNSFITDEMLHHTQAAPSENSEHELDFYITFNEKGYIIEENTFGTFGVLSNTKFEFDSLQNPIKKISKMTNGSLYSEANGKYDSKGNLIESSFFMTQKEDSSTQITENKTSYTYNESNDLIASTWTELIKDNKSGSTVKGKSVLEYENGLLAKTSVYENDRKVSETKYVYKNETLFQSQYTSMFDGHTMTRTYGENGKIIEENMMPNMRKTYAYNSQGDKSEVITIYEKTPEKWTFSYEYDTTGNWTEQKQYHNGSLVYTIKREITYW